MVSEHRIMFFLCKQWQQNKVGVVPFQLQGDQRVQVNYRDGACTEKIGEWEPELSTSHCSSHPHRKRMVPTLRWQWLQNRFSNSFCAKSCSLTRISKCFSEVSRHVIFISTSNSKCVPLGSPFLSEKINRDPQLLWQTGPSQFLQQQRSTKVAEWKECSHGSGVCKGQSLGAWLVQGAICSSWLWWQTVRIAQGPPQIARHVSLSDIKHVTPFLIINAHVLSRQNSHITSNLLYSDWAWLTYRHLEMHHFLWELFGSLEREIDVSPIFSSDFAPYLPSLLLLHKVSWGHLEWPLSAPIEIFPLPHTAEHS